MQLPPDLWAYAALAAVLVAAAITDARTGRIYNVVTYPAIAVGLIGHSLLGGWSGREDVMGLSDALAGLAVGFIPMLLIWKAGGIGGGDAKLMAAIGALAGWRFALATMFYGFAIAALMALIVMFRRRIVRQTLGRVGRFIYLMFTPARPADPATPESPKVPLGVALCLGAAAALLEVLLNGPLASKLILRI